MGDLGEISAGRGVIETIAVQGRHAMTDLIIGNMLERSMTLHTSRVEWLGSASVPPPIILNAYSRFAVRGLCVDFERWASLLIPCATFPREHGSPGEPG